MEELLKCLRCGHEYTMTSVDQEEVKERVCPKCKSNSVRRLIKK